MCGVKQVIATAMKSMESESVLKELGNCARKSLMKPGMLSQTNLVQKNKTTIQSITGMQVLNRTLLYCCGKIENFQAVAGYNYIFRYNSSSWGTNNDPF
jgi:hypothetical protein